MSLPVLSPIEARVPGTLMEKARTVPRAAGMREQRWAHLLCGPVDAAAAQDGLRAPEPPAPGALEARVGMLEGEVAQLRSALQNLCDQLGVSPLRQPEKHDRADN